MVVQMGRYDGGRLAAFVRTHINSLIPFERTTEQTAETITFSSNTTTAVSKQKNYKLRKDAPLLHQVKLHCEKEE